MKTVTHLTPSASAPRWLTPRTDVDTMTAEVVDLTHNIGERICREPARYLLSPVRRLRSIVARLAELDPGPNPPAKTFEVSGTAEQWRELLNNVLTCASCDAPATREANAAFWCDRHGSDGAVDMVTAPLVRELILRLGDE